MAAITELVDFAVVDGVGVVTVDNPPRNALQPLVRDGLDGAIKTGLADPGVRALVVFCHGDGFLSGDELDDGDDPPMGAPLPAVQARIEAAGKPVVAALHGGVTGEGLELALCCHGRVAAADAHFAFREVKDGVLPGAGGTQRLPRLIGPRSALQMMLWMESLGAAAASECGLVDRIADRELLQAAMGYARALADAGGAPEPVCDRMPQVGAGTDLATLMRETRAEVARRAPGSEARAAIIECVEAAMAQPFEEGIKTEARLLLHLVMLRRAEA